MLFSIFVLFSSELYPSYQRHKSPWFNSFSCQWKRIFFLFFPFREEIVSEIRRITHRPDVCHFLRLLCRHRLIRSSGLDGCHVSPDVLGEGRKRHHQSRNLNFLYNISQELGIDRIEDILTRWQWTKRDKSSTVILDGTSPLIHLDPNHGLVYVYRHRVSDAHYIVR